MYNNVHTSLSNVVCHGQIGMTCVTACSSALPWIKLKPKSFDHHTTPPPYHYYSSPAPFYDDIPHHDPLHPPGVPPLDAVFRATPSPPVLPVSPSIVFEEEPLGGQVVQV